MFAANSKDMREIDKRTIEKYKIPGIVLMENAAFSIVKRIESHSFKRICIVCGTGNNGGDGFAAARQLYSKGYDVVVVIAGDISKIKGDALINFTALSNLDVKIYRNFEDFNDIFDRAEVIIDALLGTGLVGNVDENRAKIIHLINKRGKFIISVDIPSGISSDTGEKLGCCIYARETVTFGCYKKGHLLLDGREASGKIFIDEISIPRESILEQKLWTTTNYDDYPLNLFKKRRLDTNKGDYGRVYIIGGCYNMSGAVALSCRAALRCGSGLVYCVIPDSIIDRIGGSVREAVFMPCREEEGLISLDISTLKKIIEGADSIAFGVGIGRGNKVFEALSYILKNYSGKLVIDADGLNELSKDMELLKKTRAKVLLTPHPKEMSRLTGMDTDYIIKNRVDVALSFAKDYCCTLLLKGASTVVSDGNRVYINTSGNPGLATAGSGDVLTGIAASFLGQGFETYEAAVLSSYIHGRAGDEAFKRFGYGLVAGDISEFMGNILGTLLI